MNKNLFLIIINFLVLTIALPCQADGRRIVILEHRAGVHGAQQIANAMANQLSQLTSNKILNPNDSRRQLGSDVDAQIAQCKGEPQCIAAIGRRLNCDEVILIGISQLGDLILAIQRIDAKTGKILARLADSLTSRNNIPDQQIVQYIQHLMPPADFKRYGTIIIRTDQAGDKIYLDNAFRGETPLEPLSVSAPGRYQVRVTRKNHEDFTARLEVVPDGTMEVTPKLSPKIAPERWYQQWWVWAIVGGVVAGTATALFITSTDSNSDHVPAVVRISQ